MREKATIYGVLSKEKREMTVKRGCQNKFDSHIRKKKNAPTGMIEAFRVGCGGRI